MDQDEFAFIDVEAGTLSPWQRALILASSFINDDSSLQDLNSKNLPEASNPVNRGEGEAYLEEMDILEIAAMKGIRFDPPKWYRPGGYDAKKSDTCVSLSEKDKADLPIQEHEQAVPKAPIDLLELFKPLSQELTTKLEDLDILEIAAMKGIHFDPPRWHWPGGWDSKEKSKVALRSFV